MQRKTEGYALHIEAMHSVPELVASQLIIKGKELVKTK